jgi:predicted acyl esterase
MSGEKSVFDLNVERMRQLRKQRAEQLSAGDEGQLMATVHKAAGIRPLDQIGKVEMRDLGRVKRDGYHIDKVLLTPPDGIPLPALTYHPRDPRDGAYLYLHGQGKQADGAPGGPIEKLVSEGFVVVAVDLRGFGETRSNRQDDLLGDWKDFYLSYLLGQSLVGLRAEDAIACGRWVANYQTTEPRDVHLVGVGAAAVPALHAAALAPELFKTVSLRDTFKSWEEVVGETSRADALTNSVHGALRRYDLTDLTRSLGKRAVAE